MPRPYRDEDAEEEADDWDGAEFESDGDSFDEDNEPTIACPYCQREIHEDAQRCPYCERYISAEDAASPRKPWWIVVGALACLYVVYRWIAG